MKLCSKCGKLSYYNSHFGVYICEKCGYREPEITTSMQSKKVSVTLRHVVLGRHSRTRDAERELVPRD